MPNMTKTKIKWVYKGFVDNLVTGKIYDAILFPSKNASNSSRKGSLHIYKDDVLLKNFYYPDDNLFIILKEDLFGLEKEIEDLSFMGYRNG